MFELPGPSPELKLLALTSYLPVSTSGLKHQQMRLTQLLERGVDSHQLVALIDRHRTFALTPTVLRLHGLLHETLPASRVDMVLEAERECRKQGLVLVSERHRLSSIFQEMPLEVLSLKGPDLSARLYGDVGLRHCKDLDLFVAREQLEGACQALYRAGYQLDPVGEVVWSRYRESLDRYLSEFSLFNSAGRLWVDLHWAYEAPIQHQDYETAWGELLKEDRNLAEFLYLVWHGTKHGWHRLKWLGDLASILDREPEIFERAQIPAGRLRLQAYLSDALILLGCFGLHPKQPGSDGKDRTSFFCQYAHKEAAEESVAARLSHASVRLRAWYALMGRYPMRLRLRAMMRKWWSARDLLTWKPPKMCLWVLPLVRPFTFLRRFLRRSGL